MSGMLLSCANMPIVKQVADLLGFVMNIIYVLFDKIGFANIGLCIIVFTILVRVLMFPMTKKQQKTTKLSSIITPEVQAIQKKYAGKKDSDSMMKMNAETRAVYEKYGSSPTGGCLPLLIQMVIILALYGVISSIPSHVGAVSDIYKDAAKNIVSSVEDFKEISTLNNILVENKIEGFEKNEDYDKKVKSYYGESKDKVETTIYEILSDQYKRQSAGLDRSQDCWEDIKQMVEISSDIISKLDKISDEDLEKIKASVKDEKLDIIVKYTELTKADVNKKIDDYDKSYNLAVENKNKIADIYTFAGINLSRSPGQESTDGIWWALLIPILSAAGQWVSTSMMQKNQPTIGDNTMASSMKAMTVVGPFMSGFFCYSLAAGIGIYWAVGSVIQIIQQYFINKYFEKTDINDIIKANIEEKNKKNAKKGIPAQKIATAANTNVKNIKPVGNNNSSDKPVNTNYKKGGIAAKANMVKEFNEKNNK